MRAVRLGFALALLSGPLLAEAPLVSIYPKARAVAAPEPSEALVTLASSVRPIPRPGLPTAQPQSRNPKPSRSGSVCGDPAIRGIELEAVTSSISGCGIAEPVKVSAVSGVRFSQPAIIDCTTAKAFNKWVKKGMQPAFGRREVVELQIFGSYSCRGRNNVKGAKISEHGRGKAIDIAGFIFADGSTWTVQNDYNKTIRKAQKAACGIFGTTLGPGSDGYHQDHLHLDTARQSRGPYCR